MIKYRIIQTGDKYWPGRKRHRFSRWDNYICAVTKDESCAVIKRWKAEENVIVHKPEDICGQEDQCNGE